MDPQSKLVTDYYYDGFGNITDKVLTPAELSARAIFANQYDARGRFVQTSQNVLGHSTTFVNHPFLGKPLSSTGPNQLTTSWSYDPVGRVVCEQRPDGTSTTNRYAWDFSTTVTAPLDTSGSAFVAQTSAYKLRSEADGSPPVTTWYDKQGREIRVKTESADGRTILKDTGYNAIAQPVAVSKLYFSGNAPVYTISEYDALGREQYVTAPDGIVTEMVYDGLTTQVVKDSASKGSAQAVPQVTKSVKNAQGNLVRVTDAMTNTVAYLYDPVGNLVQTTDSENNRIEMRYDIRGNKIWQSDPDMGEWTYQYDALDQLKVQIDARSSRIETAYDVLGRVVSRTNWIQGADGLELESTARWDYDGSSEGDKLGLLRFEEHRNGGGKLVNRKRYAYDEYSRPMLELMNYDHKWYYIALEYDAFSRVLKTHRYWRPKGKEGVADNLDPEWNQFTTINTYNRYGALLAVADGDNYTWWQADASGYNEEGKLLEYECGNGLVSTATYDPLTGRTISLGIFSASKSECSDYQFSYDRFRNLKTRSHARPSMATLRETCTYDSLNRLVSTIGATNTTMRYNSLGNITARSDIGVYLYGGPRPHAVTSAGDCSYFYDASGNVIRREKKNKNEFTVTWNSFNKPVRITSGSSESEFSYSVDGRRTQQLILDGTNVSKKVYATPLFPNENLLFFVCWLGQWDASVTVCGRRGAPRRLWRLRPTRSWRKPKALRR